MGYKGLLIDRAKLICCCCLFSLMLTATTHRHDARVVLVLLIIVPTRLFVEVDDNDVDLHVCICCCCSRKLLLLPPLPATNHSLSSDYRVWRFGKFVDALFLTLALTPRTRLIVRSNRDVYSSIVVTLILLPLTS